MHIRRARGRRRPLTLGLGGVVLMLATSNVAALPVLAQEGRPTGTAFVVHPTGCLLTAAHVVTDALKVEVAIGDRRYDAAVLGVDEKRDLSVLRIQAKGLPALSLGNSSAVEVGEEVRAFGFPLARALGDSVKATRGTVTGIQTKEAQRVFGYSRLTRP
jgi:S1-C subfamily serine protease